MTKEKPVKYYSKTEEFLNVLTHGIGLLLSVWATIYLIRLALSTHNKLYIVGFSVFGICMILLYGASTFYHAVQEPKLRRKLNILDHTAIYLLIAGTYTPFMLIVLNGTWRIVMFSIVWGLALAGVVFKLFFTGRFSKLSTALYVALGWLVVIAYKPFIANAPQDCVDWIVLGGIFYTIGAVLYAVKKIPYNHAIFHFFVMFGTYFHFIAVTTLV